MIERDEIKELYQNTFEGDQITPPSHVKAKIDEHILLQKTAFPKNIFGWWFSIILFLVGISTIYTFSLVRSTDLHQIASKENRESSEKISMIEAKKSDLHHTSNVNKTYSIHKEIQLISKTNKSRHKLISIEKTINTQVNTSTEEKNKQFYYNKSSNLISDQSQKTALLSSSIHSQKMKKVHSKKSVDSSVNQQPISAIPIIDKIEFTQFKSNSETNHQTDKSNVPNNTENKENSKMDVPEDSSKSNEMLTENKPLVTIPAQNNKSFLVSFRAGTTFPINHISTSKSFDLKEKNGFNSTVDLTYFFTKNQALSSGFQLDKSKELISETIKSFSDSTLVTYFYTYVIDSNQTIIDSIAHPIYDSLTSFTSIHSNYSLFSIALPINYQFSIPLKSSFWLDLNAGLSVNYQRSKVQTSDLLSSESRINSIGLKACLRTQLRYQFNQYGVSINTNFGYDFKPTQTWVDVQRKRAFLGVGIGFHYIVGKH